jgi:hypothetical protein
VQRLRDALARLQGETARLRGVADASESKLKIEQSAQRQLASQVKALEAQNARLREDLALFESLAPSADRLTINSFTVRPDVLPGEYRYRLLVLLGGGRKDRHFQGSLQLLVNAGDETLVIPDPAQPESGPFKLNFKHFQRVEGTFRVPPPRKVQSVQVRVLEHGASQARAVQSVDLS